MEDIKNVCLQFLKNKITTIRRFKTTGKNNDKKILKDSIRALNDKKNDLGKYSNVLLKKTTREI